MDTRWPLIAGVPGLSGAVRRALGHSRLAPEYRRSRMRAKCSKKRYGSVTACSPPRECLSLRCSLQSPPCLRRVPRSPEDAGTSSRGHRGRGAVRQSRQPSPSVSPQSPTPTDVTESGRGGSFGEKRREAESCKGPSSKMIIRPTMAGALRRIRMRKLLQSHRPHDSAGHWRNRVRGRIASNPIRSDGDASSRK
jgi:hypothetical protein